MSHRKTRDQSGYTLIELIISLTLLAVITGALTAAFITTNNANANTAERIHESNDAQLTAGFWTADAQAAGGIDPSLGETDTTLGVLASADDGGCSLGGGAKVIGFKWREWAGRSVTPNGTVDSYTTRVANYVYRSSTHELERRTCANTVSTGIVTLANRVASLPVVTCDGTSPCPALPRRVKIAVTETNDPYTGPQYSFELTATVRSDSQTTRASTNSESSPLLILGGTCTAGAGFSVGGSTTLIVNGVTLIDATDGPGCTAMTVSGGAHGYGADGTSIAAGGSCGPDHCPAWTTTTSFGDPFASLAPPSTSGCGGGTNPARDGSGNFVPGTYPQVLNLSGSVLMNPGTYVLCNGISGSTTTRSSGVFLYVAGGTITDHLSFTAPTSGPYQSVGLWIATSTPWLLAGGASVNIGGAVYAPTTGIINNAGNASFTVSVLVARNVTFTGNSGVTITGTGTPRSPIVTASTGSALRTVNLSWVPQTFPGMSPITGYEYRADRGSGVFGSWTSIAGGAAAASLVDTCGTSNTVPTTCKYQVRAINVVGAGSPSNIAFADSAFDGTAPAVAITAPTPGGRTGLSSTITGTAGNGATDSATVVVSLYAGSNCTGAVQTFNVSRSGTNWSVPTGAMTAGPKSVCATQSDTAGNIGFAGPINFTAGQVLNVSVANGGTLGKADKGDTVTVQFAQAMTESTICSAWSGNGPQSITGNNAVTVTITDGAAGNDVLTASSTSCPQFNLGTIDLGSPSWVPSGVAMFKGTNGNKSTITYTAAANTLTITLGLLSSGAVGTGVGASTVTYTPGAALRDAANNAIAGTYAFTNQRF